MCRPSAHVGSGRTEGPCVLTFLSLAAKVADRRLVTVLPQFPQKRISREKVVESGSSAIGTVSSAAPLAPQGRFPPPAQYRLVSCFPETRSGGRTAAPVREPYSRVHLSVLVPTSGRGWGGAGLAGHSLGTNPHSCHQQCRRARAGGHRTLRTSPLTSLVPSFLVSSASWRVWVGLDQADSPPLGYSVTS